MKKTALLLVFVLTLSCMLSSCLKSDVKTDGAPIKRGTINVSLKASDDNVAYNDIVASRYIIGGDNFLWEPGRTVVQYIQISNVGSLAFKYQLMLTAENNNALSEVIEVYAKDVDASFSLQELDELDMLGYAKDTDCVSSGALFAGESQIVCIALRMPPNVSNDYIGILNYYSVQVVAAQYTYEEDSFDSEYDKDAVFPD